MQKQRVSIRRYNFNEDKHDRFYAIAKQSFSYGSPWSVEQYRETLAREDLVFFVAEIETHLIGYIGGKLFLDEAEIYTIVVSKEFQQQQVAHFLLNRFEEECHSEEIDTIFLEVRESNEIAQSFYLKNEFEVIAARNNYYTQPLENAIIMKSKSREKAEHGKEADLSDRDKL
ncbi:ribosomal protein S18-alanine N-acetyltransferase [Alkalibacterium sp. f15]|uniref:ribosomal protein S18-alanine N-acetyltransferase n=1 Tax=Alkalibacterium sp. f15 TaxID=3414029 RepID=UPI003BF83F8B